MSTIQNADAIAVVAGGKIIEIGDHQGLKKKGSGTYFKHIQQQQEMENDGSRQQL